MVLLYVCIGLAESDVAGGMCNLPCGMPALAWWHMDALALGHRLSYPTVSGILAPWPGMEPESSALEGKVLSPGPPGRFPDSIF